MAVSKSTNDGGSWSLSTVNDIGGMVNSIAVDPTNPNTIYIGGEKSSNYRGCVFKSIDGGSSWIELGASLFNDTYDVFEVCVDPYNASKIYVCTNEGVYISNDEGVNWQSPSAWWNTKCIVANPTIPNHLYIGSSSGVYHSSDGGSSWHEMNDGLFYEDVRCLDFDPIHQTLYAGTYGKGVFRYQLDTGVNDTEADIPASFKLLQNVPNPFNPKTTIFYELPEACHVHMAIHNLRGQEVSVLVEEHKGAGMHTIIWDAKNAPSGVYICRMRAGKYTRSIKLLFNR